MNAEGKGAFAACGRCMFCLVIASPEAWTGKIGMGMCTRPPDLYARFLLALADVSFGHSMEGRHVEVSVINTVCPDCTCFVMAVSLFDWCCALVLMPPSFGE